MRYLQIAEMGLKSFTKYGKLIGTGKNNGIQVFEKLLNGERILTSVGQNGEILKTIRTQDTWVDGTIPSLRKTLENANDSFSLRTTTVQNHVTGEELMHIYTPKHHYDRVVRSNTNDWESFTAISPNKQAKITAYNDIEGKINFSSYDLQNQKGIAIESSGSYIECNSRQLKDGQQTMYELKEGVNIPHFINGHHSWVKPGIMNDAYGGEKNLTSQVLGYFSNMFAKLCGYQSKV